MMKKLSFIAVFTFFSLVTFSQNIGINKTGALPNNSAGLDIDYDNKGLLLPRMTTSERNAIPNPAHSLLIFNTTTDCFETYNSGTSTWLNFGCISVPCTNNQPQSDFSWNATLTGQNVTFTPNDMTADSYSWTFDQATPNNSTNTVPNNIVWANPGTYNVTLTTTFNGVGCFTTTHTVTVTAPPSGVSVTFSNCGQTGRTGPSQGQCNTAYSGTPLAGNVTVNNGVQQWTAPITGVYTIEVDGAKGGDGNSTYVGGNGSKMQGEFTLTAGTVLNIIVGQMGHNTSYAGGGGASAVWESSNPIIIAGGGGGGNNITNPNQGFNASTGENGVSSYGAGGVNGLGGVGGTTLTQGGAGFLGNGLYNGSGNGPAQALINGGAGGDGYSGTYWGGFGGGGAGFGGGGGGGGYSGGGGGLYNSVANTAPGGGGGSYIAPSATNVATSNGNYNGNATFNGSAVGNIGSFNAANGQVVISY